jgi:hypothetical protein
LGIYEPQRIQQVKSKQRKIKDAQFSLANETHVITTENAYHRMHVGVAGSRLGACANQRRAE